MFKLLIEDSFYTPLLNMDLKYRHCIGSHYTILKFNSEDMFGRGVKMEEIFLWMRFICKFTHETILEKFHP